ncbi:MAG TPA: SH3 domain-containing protein [Oculatellaceae cyanobacterium]
MLQIKSKTAFTVGAFGIEILLFLAIGWPTKAEAQTNAPVHTAKIDHSRSLHKVEHILVDDTKRDLTFESFYKDLTIAAQRRDRKFLIEVLSPDVSMNLGGARGEKAFLEEWQNLSPDSAFWPRLNKVLSHGAQYDSESEEFHAPAISFEDSHSELPQCIAWNRLAALRSKPEKNATPLKSVFNEQLTVVDPKEPEPITAAWIKAKSRDGTIGFVSSSDVYGAYDEFIVFAKRNRKWCITWFGYAGL